VEPQSGASLAQAVSIETWIPTVPVDALMSMDPDRTYEGFLLDLVQQVVVPLSLGPRP
jgi:hypothetical protein